MAMGAMLEEAQPMMTAESISHQSYRRLLSRAREYVLENMSEPVTVLDLCNQLHVSRRTLQNAFHAILGIGPNAWLKRIRLNAVRRELISPWSQSTTVKDAAMQWGFWHLGQFATDYQQLFAEKPSLTLHQRMRVGVRSYTQSLTLINSLKAASGCRLLADNHTPSVPVAALTSGSTRCARQFAGQTACRDPRPD